MNRIKLDIASKSFEIDCLEGNKHYLDELAEEINNKILEVKKLNPKISFDLALLIVSFNILDDNYQLKKVKNKKLEEIDILIEQITKKILVSS